MGGFRHVGDCRMFRNLETQFSPTPRVYPKVEVSAHGIRIANGLPA